jgi:hypothetical protein
MMRDQQHGDFADLFERAQSVPQFAALQAAPSSP